MKKDTELVELGRDKKWTGKAVNPSLVRASTIVFDTMAEMEESPKLGHKGVEYYGRRGTSTTFAFCKAMAELDGAAGCYAYPCGTSAITASLMSFLAAGDHLLMPDSVYEPTRKFCSKTLARFGVKTDYYDPMLGTQIAGMVKDNTKVIFMESPCSLSMEVQDVPAIVSVAKQHGITTIIDNTYATPLNFRPLDFGVDVSVQSATKYINGHSDVMLGIACANEKAWPTLNHHSYELGLCTSVDDLYTGLRGLRTLGVRLKQHEQSALAVAEWLEQREEVDHIRHPAFSTCPGYEFFKRDFSGGNGLFSFVLNRGDDRSVAAMLDDMRYFKMGFSWGGYESLILAATNMPGRRTTVPWEAAGPLIRLHIGLEDTEDLIEDLAAGLDRLNLHL
jgi:cystathionine beta-lyase